MHALMKIYKNGMYCVSANPTSRDPPKQQQLQQQQQQLYIIYNKHQPCTIPIENHIMKVLSQLI